jgi:predicted nucleotidyltransferase
MFPTRLIGSRARGQAHDISDWDVAVETDDFASVSRDVPVIHGSAAGLVKVDLLFLDQSREVSPAYEPSPDTLAAIDTHFLGLDHLDRTEANSRPRAARPGVPSVDVCSNA